MADTTISQLAASGLPVNINALMEIEVPGIGSLQTTVAKAVASFLASSNFDPDGTYAAGSFGNALAQAIEAGGAAQLTEDLATDDGTHGAAMVGGAMRSAESIAALRGLPKSGSKRVYVAAYYANVFGGGGVYTLDSSDSSSVDNGGTVIVATDGGRWKLRATGLVSIKQFGCRGDGTSNDGDALQQAVTWATKATGRGLLAESGHYIVQRGITKAQSFIGLTLFGESTNDVLFDFTAADTHDTDGNLVSGGAGGFNLIGGSGTICNGIVRNVSMNGLATTTIVNFQGLDGQWFHNCRVVGGRRGGLFFNKDAGSFTEWCGFVDSKFLPDVLVKLEYLRDGGDASFHGCGLLGKCLINASPAGGPIVKIGDNGNECLVYNSPFYAQIWMDGYPTTVFQILNTSTMCSLEGCITLEPDSSGPVTLATSAAAGLSLPFVGRILSNNQNVTFGALFLCDEVYLTSNGGRQVRGGRRSAKTTTTGTSTTLSAIPASMATGGLSYWVWIVGANYDWRGIVEVWPSGNFTSTPAVRTLVAINGAGLPSGGIPAFTLDGSQRLVVTNAGYTSGNFTVFYDCKQVAQSTDYAFIG